MDHNTAQRLSLKQVDRLMDVGNAKVLRQGRIFATNGLVHFPGDAAVGEVSCRRRAEFSDVERLSKIHFEQRPSACTKGQNIGRVFHKAGISNINKCFMRLGHGCVVLREPSGFRQSFRNLVAVNRREGLQDLYAAAMTVHIAEAADIHQDVEAQSLTGGELAQQLVVAPAMARAERDDLVAARRIQSGDGACDLAV